MKHCLIYLLLGLLALSACSKKQYTNRDEAAQADRYDTLIILSTNDVHARIDNMAKEAAFIDSIKKSYSRVLVVSAGDIFSGSPVVDQYPQRGYPIVELMNLIGYQAISLGNHDFDYGQKVLKDRAEQANFPFLCANADFSKTALIGKIKPYRIVTVNAIRVVLLAFVQIDEDGTPASHPKNTSNISFEDALTLAPSYISLRDSGEVFLILSHLGIETDRQLAGLFPQPDVIIGGHSHTKLQPAEIINGVLVTQAAAYLNYIGQTMLILKNGKVVSKTNSLIKVNTLTAVDSNVQNHINTYNANPDLHRVIGRAMADFSGKEALGSLMTDAITQQHHLDIAFTNNGGIRVNTIPQGSISIAQIYELDPFNNEVVVFSMSLNEIKDFIKYTFNKHQSVELQISGAHYTIKTSTNGNAEEVILKDNAGNLLDTGKQYKVGMNSYLAETDMTKIMHANAGISLYISAAETLMNYIIKEKEISPTEKRITIE